jgi:trans-aconitate methyltransferase
VQPEEVEEALESEKEMVEPEPQRQPEPIKRKQPQVRPWDIGKEGELWCALCSVDWLKLHIYLFIRYLL